MFVIIFICVALILIAVWYYFYVVFKDIILDLKFKLKWKK